MKIMLITKSKSLATAVITLATVSTLLAPPALAQTQKDQKDDNTVGASIEKSNGQPTDYNNPLVDSRETARRHIAYFHVTVCAGQGWLGPWYPRGAKFVQPPTCTPKDVPERPKGTPTHGVAQTDRGESGGTQPYNGAIQIKGRFGDPGDTEVDISDGAAHCIVLIHVVDCSHALAPGTTRGVTSALSALGSTVMNMMPGLPTPDTADTPFTGGDAPVDDSSTRDSSDTAAKPGDTITDTTTATGGQPGIFGGSANVTAPQKQFPVSSEKP